MNTRPAAGFRTLGRLVRFFNRLDTPSFAPELRVPLWKSLLIDWGRLFTLGIYKPNAKMTTPKDVVE